MSENVLYVWECNILDTLSEVFIINQIWECHIPRNHIPRYVYMWFLNMCIFLRILYSWNQTPPKRQLVNYNPRYVVLIDNWVAESACSQVYQGEGKVHSILDIQVKSKWLITCMPLPPPQKHVTMIKPHWDLILLSWLRAGCNML